MPTLRVIAFTQLARTYLPTTGVGKFINNVVLRLAAAEGVDLKLLISQKYVGPDGQLDARAPLRGLPRVTYPFSERFAEKAWKLTGLPRATRWAGKADWMLVPAESYVPVGRSMKTLLVIHDVRYLEQSLPYNSEAAQRRDRRVWGYWLPTAVRRATKIAAVSEFTKSRIVALLGTNPDKIAVVGNGAESEFFAAADQGPQVFPRPRPEPYLLVVGGFKFGRGSHWAFAVADRLKAMGSPMLVISAGRDFEDSIPQADSRSNVRRLGVVSDEQMVGLVKNATAVLFLSMYEGFGIPAIEAMAAGTPAIVSNLTALPEVAGEAGFVVDPTRAEEIADIAIRLDKDPTFRDQVVVRGRQRAANFTWDAVANRVLNVMREGGGSP